MRAIILVALSLLVAYSVAQNTAVCKSWKRQPKGARCKNGLYKSTCAQDHASACQGKKKNTGKQSDGGNKGGQGGGGGGGASAASGGDDPSICPKWKKQGKKTYCKKAMLKRFCPSMAKKDCGKKKGGNKKPSKKQGGRAATAGSDNSEICKRWKKQGEGKYCKKLGMLRKSCPAMAKSCKGVDLDADDPPEETEESEEEETATTRAKTTTTTPAFDVHENLKECCRANGVKPACMGLCEYETPDAKAVCNPSNNCETEIKKALYCGTNGQDLSSCCANAKIPAQCKYMCNGKTPESGYPQVDNLGDVLAKQKCFKIGTKPNLECSIPESSGKKDWEVRTWKKQSWAPVIGNFVLNNPPCK